MKQQHQWVIGKDRGGGGGGWNEAFSGNCHFTYLFVLILYVSVKTFQSCRDGSSLVGPVISR